MIEQWKHILNERAAAWRVPSGGEWKCLFFNNYQPNYSTITLLWFHGGDAFPAVVTKLFRSPEIPQREFDSLVYAHSKVPAIVPRPLHVGREGNFWALWMEGVPGFPAKAEDMAPANLRSLVQSVVSLHSVPLRFAAPDAAERYRRLVSQPLEAVSAFGSSPAVRQGCAGLRAAIVPGDMAELRPIPQHGDLFAGNALLHEGRWRVIDWENYGAIDLPFFDLLTLLISLLRTGCDSAAQWPQRLVKELPAAMALYAESLSLPQAAVRTVLPLTLANWFYVQWCDGRKEFAERMYRTIEDYFRNTAIWQAAFTGSDARQRPAAA